MINDHTNNFRLSKVARTALFTPEKDSSGILSVHTCEKEQKSKGLFYYLDR